MPEMALTDIRLVLTHLTADYASTLPFVVGLALANVPLFDSFAQLLAAFTLWEAKGYAVTDDTLKFKTQALLGIGSHMKLTVPAFFWSSTETFKRVSTSLARLKIALTTGSDPISTDNTIMPWASRHLALEVRDIFRQTDEVRAKVFHANAGRKVHKGIHCPIAFAGWLPLGYGITAEPLSFVVDRMSLPADERAVAAFFTTDSTFFYAAWSEVNLIVSSNADPAGPACYDFNRPYFSPSCTGCGATATCNSWESKPSADKMPKDDTVQVEDAIKLMRENGDRVLLRIRPHKMST